MKPKYKALARWLRHNGQGLTRPKARRVDHEKHRPAMVKYQPESWRDDEVWSYQRSSLSPEDKRFARRGYIQAEPSQAHPDVRDQTRVLELLGRVNYKIIKGAKVYIEVDGVVYKTLYGGYWRSVFTGIEHYLLRCEQVSGSIWAEDSLTRVAVDLPIAYSNEGWTASGHSLSFMLARE